MADDKEITPAVSATLEVQPDLIAADLVAGESDVEIMEKGEPDESSQQTELEHTGEARTARTTGMLQGFRQVLNGFQCRFCTQSMTTRQFLLPHL